MVHIETKIKPNYSDSKILLNDKMDPIILFFSMKN